MAVTSVDAWPRRSLAQRVGITATLTGAITVATFAAMLIAVLAPLVTEDLGLSRVGLGMLTTSIFVGGGLTSVWAGRLVDRWGGRRTLLVLYLLGSVTLLGMALAPGYGWLLVAACLAGVPGALSNPVTNQVISVVVPVGRRGLVMGFKQSGAQVASSVGGLALPPLALAVGWRGAALVVAGIPLLGVVATRALLPAASSGPVPRAPGRLPMRGAVASLTAYGLLMSIGTAAVVTYLPLYAFEALDFSVPEAGAVASAAGIAGVIGRVLWGRASETIASPAVALAGIALAALAAVIALLLAPGVTWLVWPAAVVYGATAGAWTAVGMMAVLSEVDPRFAGRASGTVLLGFYGGFVVGPVMFGRLVDASGSYFLGWSLVGVMFVGGALVALRWHRRR